ncbi:MAG: glycine zipper domain-containing protein [Candidatus Omnitrophota bacterium]
MKIVSIILAAMFVFAFTAGNSYASDDDQDSDGSGGALTGALLGGLLGGGVGTAIGSASGNAGQGALIGAGIGAVGGALVGSSRQSGKKGRIAEDVPEPSEGKVVTEGAEVPSDMKVKKRVIKHYDEQGKLISEEEAAN